jgi:Tir chaperone protein (CesT) family
VRSAARNARARTLPAFHFQFCEHPVSADKYVYLVEALCQTVGLPDVNHVLEMRSIEVQGFDVRLDHFEGDENAIYLNFEYGAVSAGRTLTVFRLMLEANLLIYAQDQAQLGLDAETGCIVLVVRVEMTDDLDGEILADLLSHYAEHGCYWQKNIVESTDEMLNGIATGDFVWLRA